MSADRTPDDNPFPHLDPEKTIELAAGKPLIPRELPRRMEYMLDLSNKPIPVRLWDCQGWGTDANIDIIYTHDKQWALGVRNERGGYRVTDNGFRLTEFEEYDVIALCNQLDHIFPPPLIPGVKSVEPNDPKNAADAGKSKGGRGRPIDTDPKADRRIVEAWARGRGQYKSLEDLAHGLGTTKPEVKKAIDRHRQRKPDGKNRPRKPRQDP
jgi:hypothetical protein